MRRRSTRQRSVRTADQIINMQHELVRLAASRLRGLFDGEIAPLFSAQGRALGVSCSGCCCPSTSRCRRIGAESWSTTLFQHFTGRSFSTPSRTSVRLRIAQAARATVELLYRELAVAHAVGARYGPRTGHGPNRGAAAWASPSSSDGSPARRDQGSTAVDKRCQVGMFRTCAKLAVDEVAGGLRQAGPAYSRSCASWGSGCITGRTPRDLGKPQPRTAFERLLIARRL